MGSAVLAVDLGGTKVAAAIVDRRGRFLRRLAAPVDRSSLRAPVDQVVALARELAAGRSPLAGAGIAVPGLVRRNGTVWAPNLPGWDAVPLARLLTRALAIPVSVESDRNAVALGESWRGAARGRTDVVVLITGTGIGAGIISGGDIVRGAHELSGCAGWLVVSDDRPRGARRCGTLESLAAGPAVAAAAGCATAEAAADAARRGNRRARAAFARAGRFLGLGVANLISLFDPQIVVLTGGLASAADLFIDDLRRAALERAQPLSIKEVDIAVSTLRGEANLLGAARLALDRGPERAALLVGRPS
jgi:glucokinase